MKIGFIGLGKMGTGMARNLLRAGHQLKLYNRTREKAEVLVKEGASVVNSPAEAATDTEAVFTMLADDPALGEVVFGEKGLAATLRPDTVHISSSTISVSFARKLVEEHAKRAQTLVSAPVFGRPEAAESKKLIVILAGEERAVQRCRALADAIGRRTFVIGREPWQANVIKLCGNFMIASMLEAFSEGFAAMRKAGIDEHYFLEAMVELFGSPVYKNYGTIIADRKFEPAGFGLKLGLKDVRQVVELSGELNAPMPFASVVRDHLVSALAHSQENLDWSSLSLVLARAAGLET
jgi:3-hydroxyisobutyrate dehydrogenase-like beta-hydroxyacid dehydrogenase